MNSRVANVDARMDAQMDGKLDPYAMPEAGATKMKITA